MMMQDAIQGYRSSRATTASPRGVERGLLRQIAGEIDAAGNDYGKLALAVQRNTELWTALAVDLAGSGNGLPDALRAGLLSLANFAVKHARAVLADEASASVLSEINRNVAAGLDQAAPAQEAA